jgi:hypothetical protein
MKARKHRSPLLRTLTKKSRMKSLHKKLRTKSSKMQWKRRMFLCRMVSLAPKGNPEIMMTMMRI